MTPEETAAAEKAAQATAQAAELAKKKGMASHFTKTAMHHEKMAARHEKMAAHHETMHEACKADVESKDAPSASVASGDYYKAAGAYHKGMASEHEKCGKCHMAAAEHNHGMAEGYDAEEHAKVAKAIKDADAAEPTPAPVVKAAPSIDNDVAAEMAKQRNSPEYKQALSDLAKAALDEELKALREKTLAPDGVRMAATGTDGPGPRIVPRGGGEEPFKFAKAESTTSSAGI